MFQNRGPRRKRVPTATSRMRLILSLTVLAAALGACGSPGPAPQPSVALTDADAAVAESRAEAAAIEREQGLLDAMAAEGIFPVGQPAQATVKYHREDVTFGLYNEAYTAQSDLYSEARASANYKVVPNLDMGALWKSLEEAEFFKLAQSGIVRVPGASVSVVIRRGTESWTLAWAPSMDQARYDATMESARAVGALFNGTYGLQRVNNPSGADYFEQERDRLRELNKNKVRPGGGR
ncbi:MAG: hypothetical protein O3A20_03140 [Planctomycetota bacterium]|nr:hypothetical protein [Planctomycetota bacterium]